MQPVRIYCRLTSAYRRGPHPCIYQVGGSDQWGNITAGIDLIHRLESSGGAAEASELAYGLTLPLLTDQQGIKFGKSAGNAVWLDATMTSPFDLHQYFLRTDDSLAEHLVRFYTFLPELEIDRLLAAHRVRPGPMPRAAPWLG